MNGVGALTDRSRSRTWHTLARDVGVYAVLLVSTGLINVLLTPLYARSLTKDEVALITVTSSIVALLAAIALRWRTLLTGGTGTPMTTRCVAAHSRRGRGCFRALARAHRRGPAFQWLDRGSVWGAGGRDHSDVAAPHGSSPCCASS